VLIPFDRTFELSPANQYWPGPFDARQLEGQLKHLNARLLELNEQFEEIERQRDAVRLRMRHVARELQRLQAVAVKEAYVEGRLT
jgi:hypothetical protein